MDDNKSKALAAALSQIEKQFGKGSIMKMDAEAIKDIEVVSTGSLGLDLALGVGGLPRGRVVEIYGPESSGKTTLTLQVIAEVQKAGGTAAFIDAENALDVTYAGKLGVKTEDLLISQPDTGEQALEIADMLVRSGAIDVVVIDSVAALTPRAEIEGEMGDTHVGLQARLMSQALRKLTANLNRSNTICIFINQLREKIGITYGSPEVAPGGRALKFYSSVRLDIRRIESIKDGAEVVGNRTRVKVAKNKCVAAGTTVFDPATGLTHRVEEIVEQGQGDSVVAADKVGKLHVRPIVQRFDQGEANAHLALARWAGVWGHLAPTKRIPAPFFAPDVSADVVANLIFGLFESDGHVSREQTGGLRLGFSTTSEQLAHQVHWLLLRWGIGSSVRVYDPTNQRPSIVKGRRVQAKLPIWEVRVSGVD